MQVLVDDVQNKGHTSHVTGQYCSAILLSVNALCVHPLILYVLLIKEAQFSNAPLIGVPTSALFNPSSLSMQLQSLVPQAQLSELAEVPSVTEHGA